uniref:Transposase Tc1-like domain-containing protein n=1 Tax=Hippocampus comes TaxID=109280 RepID=A0A3Q3DFA6_HIPCM
MLQTGRYQTEVATELSVSQGVIRGGSPLATSFADDRYIVNNALRNRTMNATQLQACLREVRAMPVSQQTIQNHLHQRGLRARRPARVPGHPTGHRSHRLAWTRKHLRWDQWASVLLHWGVLDHHALHLTAYIALLDTGESKVECWLHAHYSLVGCWA